MQWIRWMLGAWAANVVLAGVAAAGSYTDLRWLRLPNWLTFGAAAFGLALQVGLRGMDGARDSILGWLLGCALLFLPFALGGMGAGDVKLMGAIGALKGPFFVLNAFVYTAFFGGALALLVMAERRGALNWLRGLSATLGRGVHASIATRQASSPIRIAIRHDGGLVPMAAEDEQKIGLPTALPYGVAIAAGAILAMVLGH